MAPSFVFHVSFSYISAISEVITDPSETCEGLAKNDAGEARLDIIDSEINREFLRTDLALATFLCCATTHDQRNSNSTATDRRIDSRIPGIWWYR